MPIPKGCILPETVAGTPIFYPVAQRYRRRIGKNRATPLVTAKAAVIRWPDPQVRCDPHLTRPQARLARDLLT
ncbi:hypothetical protein [Roseobacter sp. N2S]|uniref:hypothetical protein n=1 Tax=Roseobacter sp. N2S TaxID=2663844 RepID=UPI002856EB55|nr:hypothetical protein [Roseobacter sp. N2S]MDR6266309.1 hypothetical protein [Roseobacter sp. N2S]